MESHRLQCVLKVYLRPIYTCILHALNENDSASRDFILQSPDFRPPILGLSVDPFNSSDLLIFGHLDANIGLLGTALLWNINKTREF